MTAPTYGLVEAGGTKFVLGVADANDCIQTRHRIATTTPAETLSRAIAWFAEQRVEFAAIGIASFGPLDLDRASPCWGQLRVTPKPHWTGAAVARPFAEAFGCPVAIDTDVNGAALAEARWGAGRGFGSLLYLTVGTGIGGGYCTGDRLLQGLSHPEMGHIKVPRHPDDVNFAGACGIHGDCLEGVASGPAVLARWGLPLSDLPSDHPGRGIIAWYLGQALVTFQAVLEPARMVLGGGVMATPGLLDLVRAAAVTAGGGYFVGNAAEIVVAPGLGDDSGLLGALALALRLTS